MTLMIQAKWIPKVTVREQSSSTKRSWAIIGRKYSFNEDLFKASQQPSDDPSATSAATQPKSNKSATLGASSGSKLLRSSSFSNMLSKDDSGTIGTLVGYFLFSLYVSTCIECSNSSLPCFICLVLNVGMVFSLMFLHHSEVSLLVGRLSHNVMGMLPCACL